MQRLTAITHARFSLIRFRSPLLTESRLLSLPVGTEMFHFPTFPPRTLCVQVRVTGLASSRVSPFGNPRITVWLSMRVTGLASSRVSPFGNPRITVWLSTPRGLSQIPTSFFGSWCQGIHRVPLKTWPQRCSRPLCSSQHTGGDPIRNWHPHPRRMRYDQDQAPFRKAPELTPDPSGPNNVPGTDHPTRPTLHDPPPKGSQACTGEPAQDAGAN